VYASLELPGGGTGRYYSLPQLEKEGAGQVSQLPVSLRIVLESLLRHFDGIRVKEKDVRALAGWEPNGKDRKKSLLSLPGSSFRTLPEFRCWWTWPQCAPRWQGLDTMRN